MNEKGSRIILWAVTLLMMVYTSIRMVHFESMTFPPDQQYVAIVAIAAFDGGTLGWLFFATTNAKGEWQRAISYGMVLLDMGGSVAVTMVDAQFGAAQNHLISSVGNWGEIGLWVTLGVICFNSFGGIMVHLADPVHLQHMAQEKARDIILKVANKSIENRAYQIAEEIGERMAEEWETKIFRELPSGSTNKRGLPVGGNTSVERMVESNPKKEVGQEEKETTGKFQFFSQSGKM